MDYKIAYLSNSVSDGFPTVVTVSSSASPLLSIGSNADDPGPAAVGVFSAAPAAARTEAFAQATQRLMRSAERKPAPALPGQVVRRLTVTSSSGTEQVRYATEASTTDPEFSAAESEAIALAQLLRQHPKAALSGQSAFRPTGTERLDVTIKLVNVGVAPLAIPHPDVWGGGAVSITITALRNDIPLAKLRNEHQRFVNLSTAQLTGTKPPLEPGRSITLTPSGEVTLIFTTALPLPSGGYDLWTTLETPILDPQGARLMRVELVSVKAPWQVP
jgi:hypothetical protein